jgi:lysyl-tRNA synthetase class 1
MIIRWIFASQRPNHDFALAFDEDVIKTYEEFDRAEAEVFKSTVGPKTELTRRTYQLAALGQIPERPLFRPPFRDLASRLQICDGDIARTRQRFYAAQTQSEDDARAFDERGQRALNWLAKHAPESFRYALNTKPVDVELGPKEREAVVALRGLIKATDLDAIDPKDLNQKIYDEVIRATECEPKVFFTAVYRKLIGRDQGPRLPAFLKEIGQSRVLELL